MKHYPTVYLDNAATTYPKPPEVVAAAVRAMEKAGGNPGRGAHDLSLAAAKSVYECREKIARLVNSGHPENVVFTLNTTYALNTAIRSLVRPGARTAISLFEHNSVIRPLEAMGCAVKRFDPRKPAARVVTDVRRAIAAGVEAVVCTHASNVVPLALPVKEISDVCARSGAVFILDAAQSAGALDIDMQKIKADAVCFPGHKGLYGPMGCGVCVFADKYADCADRLRTVIQGGSGVNSADRSMPDVLPERFEAGTLCLPAIAGLSAGIDAVVRTGVGAVREREFELWSRARELIGNVKGVTVYGERPADGVRYAPILLFNVNGVKPEETAARLNDNGICVRAGLHCAPDAHRALGTFPDGAVRASFGMFNTARDAESLARAVRGIVVSRES